MFDIGFWELLVIGVVTLVVVGPERLPDVARTAGVYVAKLRRFVAGVKSDINAELETGELKKILGDQREQIKELKDIVDNTRREMESSTSDTLKSVSDFSSSMESQYKEMADKAASQPLSSPSKSTTAASTITATTTATNAEADAASTTDKPVDSAADSPASEPGPANRQHAETGARVTPPAGGTTGEARNKQEGATDG